MLQPGGYEAKQLCVQGLKELVEGWAQTTEGDLPHCKWAAEDQEVHMALGKIGATLGRCFFRAERQKRAWSTNTRPKKVTSALGVNSFQGGNLKAPSDWITEVAPNAQYDRPYHRVFRDNQ